MKYLKNLREFMIYENNEANNSEMVKITKAYFDMLNEGKLPNVSTIDTRKYVRKFENDVEEFIDENVYDDGEDFLLSAFPQFFYPPILMSGLADEETILQMMKAYNEDEEQFFKAINLENYIIGGNDLINIMKLLLANKSKNPEETEETEDKEKDAYEAGLEPIIAKIKDKKERREAIKKYTKEYREKHKNEDKRELTKEENEFFKNVLYNRVDSPDELDQELVAKFKEDVNKSIEILKSNLKLSGNKPGRDLKWTPNKDPIKYLELLAKTSKFISDYKNSKSKEIEDPFTYKVFDNVVAPIAHNINSPLSSLYGQLQAFIKEIKIEKQKGIIETEYEVDVVGRFVITVFLKRIFLKLSEGFLIFYNYEYIKKAADMRKELGINPTEELPQEQSDILNTGNSGEYFSNQGGGLSGKTFFEITNIHKTFENKKREIKQLSFGAKYIYKAMF